MYTCDVARRVDEVLTNPFTCFFQLGFQPLSVTSDSPPPNPKRALFSTLQSPIAAPPSPAVPVYAPRAISAETPPAGVASPSVSVHVPITAAAVSVDALPAATMHTAPASPISPAAHATPKDVTTPASSLGVDEGKEDAEAAETNLFLSFAEQYLRQQEADEDDMVFIRYLDGADFSEVVLAGEWIKVRRRFRHL